MDRNRKYPSNHKSHNSLIDMPYYPQSQQTRIEPSYNYLPNLNKNIGPQVSKNIQLFSQRNQNSILPRYSPMGYDYSLMNNVNKVDSFLDMEKYFANLYGRKKQKRRQKERAQEKQKEKERRDKVVLPCISHVKSHCAYEKEIMHMKLQHLQDRFNRIGPLQSMDCNRMSAICPYHHNCHHCNCSQSHGVVSNPIKQPVIQSQKSRVSPQRRKKILSKFRVYGYAVYFAIIFPHYSYLFGHFKLKQFLQKYLLQENSYIRKMNNKLLSNFKQIPLYQQIQKIHQGNDYDKKSLGGKSIDRLEDPKIKISNETSNEQFVVNLNVFKKIVTLLIKTIDGVVDSLDEETCEFLGVGVLNTSYYGDQIYAVEEMPFIYSHPQKGNIKVNPKQQKALLLSNFIIKKIIHQFLIRLAVDPEWHQKMGTLSSLNNKQTTLFKLVCKQLQLCAFFLYELAIKNFYTLIQSEQPGNFLQQADTSLPLPLKTMRFPSLFMSSSQKQIFNYGFDDYLSTKLVAKNNNKKKDNTKQKDSSRMKQPNNISKNSMQKLDSIQNWQQQQKIVCQQYTSLIKEDPLNLIHNNAQFGQLSKIIAQNMKSSYEKAENSLMKIVQKLKDKVYQKRRKNYKRIHEKVMKKKYILTKQHEILQGVIFLRGDEEKKLVSMTRKMLEIYVKTLEEHQIQARYRVSDLGSKKLMQLKKNAQRISKSTNFSFISGLQSQVSSESQTKRQYKQTNGKGLINVRK